MGRNVENHPRGRASEAQHTTFRLADYQAFLEENAESIASFRVQQRAAFAEERERWNAAGQNIVEAAPEADPQNDDIALPPGGRLVCAHLPGSVWQVVAKVGDLLGEGDKLLILESMKMETAITAPCAGRIERILVAPGKTVETGQALAVLVES